MTNFFFLRNCAFFENMTSQANESAAEATSVSKYTDKETAWSEQIWAE